MTALLWTLAVVTATAALLILLWIGSYFASRAWYSGKLGAISRFASSRRTRQPKERQ